MTPLARAFGARDAFCGVALEQKFSTRIGGIGPNLDVVLKSADGTLFAIESKFGEPYTRSKTKTHLKPKYFRDELSLWTEAGLPACQGVADDLRAGHQAALGSSFGNRVRLKAALAKTKSQSTLGSPRSFTLRIQA